MIIISIILDICITVVLIHGRYCKPAFEELFCWFPDSLCQGKLEGEVSEKNRPIDYKTCICTKIGRHIDPIAPFNFPHYYHSLGGSCEDLSVGSFQGGCFGRG